jgi:hypothetical protein
MCRLNREHGARRARSFCIQGRSDAREATHPMQTPGIFRQILPVGVELSVHVGEMQESDMLLRRRGLHPEMQASNGQDKQYSEKRRKEKRVGVVVRHKDFPSGDADAADS